MNLIDMHVHAPCSLIAEHMSGSVTTVRPLLHAAGISAAVVSSLPAMNGAVVEGNRALISEAEQDPALAVFLVLDAVMFEESCQALELWSNHPKVVGVKLHPRMGGYDINGPLADRLLRKIAATRLPVLCHTVGSQVPQVHWSGKYSTIWMIKEVAESFPDVTFIAAHLGISERIDSGLLAVERCDTGNLVLDTAALELAYTDLLETAVSAVGPRRLLFGTDAPLHSPASHVQIFRSSRLTDSDKAAIGSENALRLIPRLASAVSSALEA